MATVWVTGPQILAHCRISAPTPEQTEWASAVAAAVCAGIDNRLGPGVAGSPSGECLAELVPNALTAGGEAYRRQDAPHGVTSYTDLQGVAIRVARDYLDAIRPQVDRWRTVADSIA